MRLLIAGAHGRTGVILTRLALERGHSVTALVREPSQVRGAHARLRSIVGDALAPATLGPALADVDAVVSLLAPRPRRSGRVYIEGTRNLADAAVVAGVHRFIAVSAEGAGVDPRILPMRYRLVLRIPVVARLYPDIAEMERELRVRDDLDWTIVAPAILTNGPATGDYRAERGPVVPGGLQLARADLAAFLLEIAESGRYIRERIAVAR